MQAAVMLATGSYRSWDVPPTWYRLKVGSITCSRPLDGTPFFALMSQPLTACGLPDDSRIMLQRIPSYEPGIPFLCIRLT